MHWNKGSSFLLNKRDDIENIIENYRPQVLGLSEANLRNQDNLADVQLQDYNLHTCQLLITLTMVSVGLLSIPISP